MPPLPLLPIVAGPTASGKSALALGLAAKLGGTVVNMDAMQCYADLLVLTARPTAADEAIVPHALYGVLGAAEATSAAWWRNAAIAALDAARMAGRVPILCGGTGMYLSALLRGIADIPPIPETVRAEARTLLAAHGPAWLHGRLDPASAAKLRPTDSQRISRAYEVLLATGRGIAAWQQTAPAPLAGWAPRLIVLDPPRPDLRAAIEARFAAMLEAGAVDEVRALLAQPLPADLPILRAHGVPELSAYLKGEISLDEAACRAVLATAQYTKRQATWFRHQNPVSEAHTHIIHAQISGISEFCYFENEILELFGKFVG